MPNSCMRGGNGAQKTHMVRRAFPLHNVGNYGPDKVGILRIAVAVADRRRDRAELTKPLYHIGTICQELLVSSLDAKG